jgi:hypothetical protein
MKVFDKLNGFRIFVANALEFTYFPNKGEKVKRANRFEIPGPLTDSHGNTPASKSFVFAMR